MKNEMKWNKSELSQEGEGGVGSSARHRIRRNAVMQRFHPAFLKTTGKPAGMRWSEEDEIWLKSGGWGQ